MELYTDSLNLKRELQKKEIGSITKAIRVYMQTTEIVI